MHTAAPDRQAVAPHASRSASEHGDERAASIALLPDLAHFDTHLLEGDSGDLFQVAVAGVSSNAQPRDAPFVLASSRQDAVEERATVVGAASSDSRGARARPRTAKRTSAGGAPAPSDSFPGRLDAWGFDDLSGIERAIPELVPAVAERRTWRPDSTRPGTARTNASHSRPNTSGRPSTCNSSVLSAAPTPRPPSNGTRKQSAPRASRRPMTARGQHGGQGLHAASNRRPTTARHSVTTRVGTPPQPSHALADDVLSWSDAVDEDISELLLDLGRERVPSAPTWTRPGKPQRFNENSNSITVGPVECGSVLPRVWSRPTTPQARKGELNADTFKRAEKVTHIQMPKARVDHYPRPPKPASGLKWKAVGEDGQKRPGKGRELTYSSKDKSAPSKLAAALEKKMRLQNSRAAVDEIAFDEAEWDGIWDDSGLFIDHFIKVGEGKAALFFQPALVERPPDRALKGTGKLNWGGGQTRTSGSPLHGSSAPGSPQRATYGSSHKSSYAKDEKLVGVHIKKADLKKDETQVVYSNQYRALKGLDDDSKEILEKGTGVVTGWDPDGMMVDVLWENGEIEYCCTGFCHKFHLALKVIVDDKTGHLHLQGWEDPNKKLMEKCRDYPSWDVGGDGIEWAQQNNVLEAVSLVPKTVCGVVKCMDIWDELAQQKRVKAIIKELSAAGKDAKVYQRALENSRKSVERLEKDHAVMNDWIVAKLGDEEFKIPPSSLAPPAPSTVSSCNWARPSILQEVKKQVKIDVETAKRQARFEAEAEKERIRLERKTLKIGKDPGGHKAKELAEAKARNEHRAARLKLDPWDAVLTATEEELDEILEQTFTLFDIDNSRTMDFGEFEKAMEGIGVTGQSDVLLALLQETDADGSGELDLTEFKKLAQKMIGVAKEVKNDIRKKKELQQLNRKRKAAGLPPLARLPQQAVPKGRDSASAREKGKSSSPTEAEQELKKKLAQKLQSDEDPTVRAMKEARIRAELGEGAEGAGMLWGSLAGFVVPVLSRGNTAKLSEVDPLATNALS